MRSVADELREDQMRAIGALTPEERVELAARLGEEGILLFMETQDVDRAEAVRRIKAERSAGRVHSRSKSLE